MAYPENNIVEKLATLARLHTDGALSDEEFMALKARLITQASKDVESEISKLVRETYGDDTRTTEETAFASDQAAPGSSPFPHVGRQSHSDDAQPSASAA